MSDDMGTLFLVDRPVLSTPRVLHPNESVPPLSQPKRAFGNVVVLPRQDAVGTGLGYRSHIPLTTHIRVNDTDGRALSTLVDTGTTLSCIDASLLQRMGGRPTGSPMKVQGIGSSHTLGWATLPVFLHATDPHGRHVHLEFHQDFHVLPTFPPGLCLGLDFIMGYDVSLSPTRGRGRIGRYAFPVHERLAGPYAKDAELCAAADITVPAGFQTWVPVDASCLAPGVDYTVTPRLSVTPDETVRLTGPVGLLTHGARQHVLLGNYGPTSFTLERGTIVADAVGARIGDQLSTSAQVFTVGVPDAAAASPPPDVPMEDPEDAALPLDVFDGIDVAESTLTQDAVTVLVDDAFRVGITPEGLPHASVVSLLRSHHDAFALDGRPGRIEDHDMAIKLLPDAVLPPEPPRRASPEKRAAMDSAIEQLLDWQVIEPSQSPVSFPVVMVKQNGKWRFCVDYRHYRQLNSKTVPDRYPLPTIDAIFQTLTGKKWFSSLDAIRGYHQLGVAAEDRWKTAFVCHRGLYQYKRVPFGLRNAPAIFQRLMDKVLGSLRWQQAVVYIDDAVIATDTLEEHNSALATLLDNATAVGLKFSPAKCTFAVPSLTLLGRKVSGAGVAVWADRAQAVQALARPTTLQELYHTLGLFGYYRAFIHKFAEKAAPLTRLLKGWKYESVDGQTRLVNTEGKAVSACRVPLAWGTEQQDSFEALRAAVANPPVLAHPDPSRPYILYTDASKDALAAILHQVSTAHTPVGVPDAAARVNTLSVPHLPADFARERWNAWLLEDRHFGPILRSIRSGPDSVPEWLLREDVLVRRSDDRVALPAAGLSTVLKGIHDDGGHFGFWKTFLAVSRYFWRPQLSTAVRAWVKHCDLCRQTKAAPKTGMLDISQDPTLPFDHISLDLIYGFPRSRSGNDAALVIQDLFSRIVLLAPCTKEITAEGVAALISDRVLRFGWRPRRIVSDSEARVSGSIMTQLCTSLGAVGTPSSPYHQQANSVERAVQTVQRVLQVMALDSKAHWDRRLLPAVELAMNGSPSTVTGQRPFDLVFLSHPSVVHAMFDADEHLGVSSFSERLAAAQDRLEEARGHIVSARQEQKRRFDQRRARPSLVVPGMRAWIRLRDRPVAGATTDKLDAKKLGPFHILEVVSAHRVRLDLPASLDIDPVLSIEQLDLEPLDDDPFAADRSIPAVSPRSSFVREEDAPVRRADSPASVVVESDEDADVGRSLPPRVRRPPLGLQDFQLGTVRASPSAALQDLLCGPLFKPQTLQEGDTLLTLTERPVAFLSRLTSAAESKLVAAELELVCLAWAYQKLSHLLEGVITTVVTDHAPMERMLRSTTSIAYGPIITRCRAVLMPHLANIRDGRLCWGGDVLASGQ
ncbi:hypothetical protein A4X03_0g6174 [Tilletia caries]|uniref:RNA-directed DNA polymerase n=1 Tax=Tilletia caries TaxID=13290 RepID=A0A8T8T195_9BASI|nr:hypothetical protein A4X03_0g6174 [Tilletia caries]